MKHPAGIKLKNLEAKQYKPKIASCIVFPFFHPSCRAYAKLSPKRDNPIKYVLLLLFRFKYFCNVSGTLTVQIG